MSISRLTLRWLIYASGLLGLFLLNNTLLTMLFYRYDPGSPNANHLPLLVPSVLVGVAMFLSRCSAAMTQPLIGYASDHLRSRWGCRRPFLAIGSLPLVVCFILLFTPPYFSKLDNFFYLLVLLWMFFLGMAVYQVPYLAWLPTIARSNEQRIALSTLLAIASLLGTAFAGIASPWLVFHYGFKKMAILISSLGLVALFLPLTLSEDLADPPAKSYSLWQSFHLGWQNASFRIYLVGITSAWITVSILSVCPTYIAIALLHQPISFGAAINGTFLVSTILGSVILTPISKRWGKGHSFQIAMSWSGCGLLIIALSSSWLGTHLLPWLALFMVSSLGLASIFTLPNAILPDVIERDATSLQKQQQAIYFGIRGLLIEISVGLGFFLAGTLLTLGKTSANYQGVLLSLMVSAIFALVAAWAFSFYKKLP